MAICLERGADLHMAQLMPLPLTVSCSSKIQTGFTVLVLAHPGSPGQGGVKRVCVCVCACVCVLHIRTTALKKILCLFGLWSEVQIVCIWSSWCHCIPKLRRLLPHLNPDWFYLSDIGLPRLSWKRGRKTCVVAVVVVVLWLFVLLEWMMPSLYLLWSILFTLPVIYRYRVLSQSWVTYTVAVYCVCVCFSCFFFFLFSLL